jgi:ferrous-iron efflux pump FieF
VSPTGRAAREASALRITLGVYAVVFAMKLGVWLATGVLAIFAEALHTLTDLFISSFLLAAAIWSRRSADAVHQFGHGRAQNAAALAAAVLFISFTSYKLYEEAIPHLFAPIPATYGNLGLAVAVLLVSMVLAAVPLFLLRRSGARGAAAKAQARELVNDELGLAAALVATLAIAEGEPILDPIAAIVVATIIAYGAVGLLRENVSILLGASPDEATLRRIREIARSVDGVLGVHDLRAEYVGPDALHADFHIEVAPDRTVVQANDIVREVHRRVRDQADCEFCYVHVDPAGEAGSENSPRIPPSSE